MIGQRGTALLMTMILITVIGSIAFGVGRTTLSNLRQVNRLEDSLNAYQAAQAGIEDALLRFRFDKNAEAPSAAQTLEQPNCVSPTRGTFSFSRVDISTSNSSCVNLQDQVPAPSDPSHIVYDLKMYYKKDPTLSGKPAQHECITALDFVGQEQNNGCIKTSQPAALNRDTAVEYDVSDVAGSLSMTVKFTTPINAPTATTALEILPLDDSGSVISGIGNQLLLTSLSSPSIQLSGDLGPFVLPKPSGTAKIRLRSFGNDLEKYDIYSSDQNDSLDSRITTVESIGYFGVSKRKLTLTLDRLTGTVSEVFDFVLFSGSGGICPGTCP